MLRIHLSEQKISFSDVQTVELRDITSREKTTCGYSCDILANISKHWWRKFCHSVRHYTIMTHITIYSEQCNYFILRRDYRSVLNLNWSTQNFSLVSVIDQWLAESKLWSKRSPRQQFRLSNLWVKSLARAICETMVWSNRSLWVQSLARAISETKVWSQWSLRQKFGLTDLFESKVWPQRSLR